MITNKNEAKAITEHISCDCKCKFDRTICNSNQKLNNATCRCERRNYLVSAKKIIVGILAHVFVRTVSI